MSELTIRDAKSIPDFLARCKEFNLEPVEVASEDVTQTISINYNVITGEMTWNVKKADGVQAISLMLEALWSMFEYFFKNTPRPTLTSGIAQIAANLDGDRLTVGINPTQDPTIVRGLAGVIVCELIHRAQVGIKQGWQEIFEVEL